MDLKIDDQLWSDHFPVIVSIKTGEEEEEQTESKTNRLIWGRRNVVRYREILDRNLGKYKISKENLSQEQRAAALTKVIIDTAGNNNKSVGIRKKEAWFNGNCEKFRKESMKRLREYKKHSTEKKRMEYLVANNTYKQTIMEERVKYYNNRAISLAETRNGREVWRIIKKLNGRKASDGIKVQIEEIIKRYEMNFFSESNKLALPDGTISIDELDKQLTEEEIQKAIDEQKERKAAGTDGIPAEFIKFA